MLTASQIENIKQTYKDTGRVYKTAELTGHSVQTIRKYLERVPVKKFNGRRKRVYKLNPWTGEIIKEYESMRAAAKEHFTDPWPISAAVHGTTKSCMGFAWCLAKDYEGWEVPEYTKREISKLIKKDIIGG